MAFEWKKLVSSIAPTLGTALGGPLAGMAVKVIADKVLGNPDATETDVASAFSSGLNGDQIVALKSAEDAFAIRMRELDIDVLRINQQTEQAYIADTSDARHTFGGNENVFILGICILITFALLMGSVLMGCFLLMTGYFKVDPNTAAICAGLIGTVVGYVAANAQQVVSYFYGSSKGSNANGQAISNALTETIKHAAAK